MVDRYPDASVNHMKKELMLVSGMSKHLKEVFSALQCSKINVTHTESVAGAKAGLATHSPAFILLDFDIKGANSLLNEFAFGQYIPQPYIMVAATYSDGNDRADMFKRGADYCIDKPINAHEVSAIIDAVLRRDKRIHTIEYKEMAINMSCRTVTMRGETVILTRKEYEVLCFLAKNAGTVLTKEEIYCAVWKSSYDPNSTNVADQISSLRFKLGLDRKDTTYIQTVIGVGYRFGELD
jgi:DNA-binding response OmpR family regulator